MIRPRRMMNRMGRDELARLSSNPAEIAEASVSTGSLPERNPYPIRTPYYGPVTPSASSIPISTATPMLSSAQQMWLRRRAIWFANAIGQIKGNAFVPPMDDTWQQAAWFAATGLVGDDHDPMTGGTTPGWNAEQWQAAFDYVYANHSNWYAGS